MYVTAGDGQWPATNLSTLYNKLEQANADLVIGVRQDRQKVYNFWRKGLSYGFNAFAEFFLKIKVEDANGIKMGLRGIFTEKVVSKSFFAEIERIYIAQQKGLKIVCVPVIFQSRTAGKEKGAKIKNVIFTFTDLLRFMIVRPKMDL